MRPMCPWSVPLCAPMVVISASSVEHTVEVGRGSMCQCEMLCVTVWRVTGSRVLLVGGRPRVSDGWMRTRLSQHVCGSGPLCMHAACAVPVCAVRARRSCNGVPHAHAHGREALLGGTAFHPARAAGPLAAARPGDGFCCGRTDRASNAAKGSPCGMSRGAAAATRHLSPDLTYVSQRVKRRRGWLVGV